MRLALQQQNGTRVICTVEGEVCVVFTKLPVPIHLPTQRYISLNGKYTVPDNLMVF
jgi:hypothetical protein